VDPKGGPRVYVREKGFVVEGGEAYQTYDGWSDSCIKVRDVLKATRKKATSQRLYVIARGRVTLRGEVFTLTVVIGLS